MVVLMFVEKLRLKIDDAQSVEAAPINNTVQQFRKKISADRNVAQEAINREAFVLQLKKELLMKHHTQCESTLFQCANALSKKRYGNYKSSLLIMEEIVSDKAVEDVTQCSSYSSNSQV